MIVTLTGSDRSVTPKPYLGVVDLKLRQFSDNFGRRGDTVTT